MTPKCSRAARSRWNNTRSEFKVMRLVGCGGGAAAPAPHQWGGLEGPKAPPNLPIESIKEVAMKLGLLTAALPDLSLEACADWAAANGFGAIEIACWPAGAGAARRYAGVSHIDV